MWDNSFMADIDNFSEITENFDTIKTLLNSIRAQGILNTSDVDKLLSGINSKLEKLNTEEDIDLIKIFLSELKQNLDERHSVLVSKFGAIEALFSNLLKNSSEMPKSAELKELFDIVATNLSVFSREVVSQKESLTDITLKLDALRSDDSQKRDIIKNISLLKSDLERLNNGFDSIVLSLNDNFKTIIKTITTIDQTEHLDKFAENLSSIEMSSNTILSALQMLDRKTENLDDYLKNIVTKDDLKNTDSRLFEIVAQGKDVSESLVQLTDRYASIETLADKIDASVNIIAGLKAVLEEADNKTIRVISEQLARLEDELKTISSDTKFDEFKVSLEAVLKSIIESNILFDKNLQTTLQEIQRLAETVKALNISTSFNNVLSKLGQTETSIKTHISDSEQKVITLQDANITRVLNDISTNADTLGAKLNNAQSSIAVLCEKNFNSVFENILDLKNIVSQIDENSISANNAIFSSITDRLTLFENSLRESLDIQEKTVSTSSSKLEEQIENIKNLSGILDYKIDSSVVEVGNVKREFGVLKTAVENMLALDFVNTVKDLRVDLYASKQEMVNTFESSTGEMSEKLTNDLYGKYELLISKLDTVEDEFKKTQTASLTGLKGVLENISGSIVDILSYVSEKPVDTTESINASFNELTDAIKSNGLNYLENVRDVVDVIRAQVETNLKSIEEETLINIDSVKKSISENSEDIKKDIKYSYSKLLEIQDSYNEIKELLNVNSINTTDKFDGVLASTDGIKEDFESKLNVVKFALLDKIAEFKKEFTCENAQNISEFKFSIENIYSKSAQDTADLISKLKETTVQLSSEASTTRTESLSKILDNFSSIQKLFESLSEKSSESRAKDTNLILENFDSIKELLSALNDKSADALAEKVDVILRDFAHVKSILEKVDENIDGDMTRQLSIIESNFESLVSQMAILFDKSDRALTDKINSEFTDISVRMQDLVAEKLEAYKYTIEETFERLSQKAESQSNVLQEHISGLNTAMKAVWSEQADENCKQIEEIAEKLKGILDENVKLTAVDYVSLKNKLNEFAKNIESNNQVLTQDLKAQLDDITKYLDSVLDIQNEESAARHEALVEHIKQLENAVNMNKSGMGELTETVSQDITGLKSTVAEVSAGTLESVGIYVDKILEQIELAKQNTETCKNLIVDSLNKELKLISQDVEKETDVIIAELIEQFELIKASQADDIVNLTSRIEEIVNSHIYSNIEDLKSYLDVKTDSSVLSEKLDNLKIEMSTSIEGMIENMDKLLDAGSFTSAMSDYRLANEIFVNSAVDRLNDKVEAFISENMSVIGNVLTNNSKDIEEKLAFFDKKFVETVIDKYEEIKLIANRYNDSFSSIEKSINDVLVNFTSVKEDVFSKIDSLTETVKHANDITTEGIKHLSDSFDNLKSQISNKSFDEAFQASINKQIGSLEALVSEQLGYIEDINQLCVTNLPDITEMSTLVKHSILESINKFSEKMDEKDIEGTLESELKQFKSDVITQFLNIFNQVSFVAEQEEIIDFIQEKHDELITVLSHIVTTTDSVAAVNDKIDSLKDEIGTINEKITSIISADGDIDYVYSLQDLESDIANLRLALNEMKENSHDEEFNNLVSSTNDIYKLVETIKSELPNKNDFESIAEDIVSISTRTNKLLLASDESYKALQDNLQDFKLVINDLDERTRNFSQEAGIDRLDSKINALNSMMVNGAKTNQVFNQVFEYLAEWVDNASTQINSISDRVESLDEIGQIKTMLNDLKAEAEDNSESVELVEALGSVFDKQTKRISSIETKLDRIIVDNTVNASNIPNWSNMEETLNRFLVAMDEKFVTQQERINSLEAKLETAMSLLDDKSTVQLTKKVGGMDRQIAKLNKSIEKIASHVVEK